MGRERPPQNLLVALNDGRRVTIGLEPAADLRRLSDERRLTCPGCAGSVVLHAGTVRAHHFAHMPGARCSLPVCEPETEEHRAGKLLLAEWLRGSLPDSQILIEAYLPATDQRADVLAILPGGSRIALEYQCAPLSAREWRSRHQKYRHSGIRDLWLLGGSRLILSEARPDSPGSAPSSAGVAVTLRTAEIERALLCDGAPLLFFDSVGDGRAVGTLARFRPEADARSQHPRGSLVTRALARLPFPFHLLDWPSKSAVDPPASAAATSAPASPSDPSGSDLWLWQWIGQRFQVTPTTLSPFFGLEINGSQAFSCRPSAWQAAIYYRFVHRRIGERWWLGEIETWVRGFVPMTKPLQESRLRAALADYQEALAAAGILSLPAGYGRANARVIADLTTLDAPPDRAEVLRLVRYRRTLARENSADYRTR